jgi:Tfp pilus assembly protein PilZ
MMEKRKVERFDLRIETMLHIQDEAGTDKPLVLFSRDISSDGVFLATDNPLSIGTKVDLNFLLSLDELHGNLKNKVVNISTSGRVIRSEQKGFAVEFEKISKVSQLKQHA